MNINDYIHDDDRTPRERKPQEPVRCLDDELLPPLPVSTTCRACGGVLLSKRAKTPLCSACRHDAHYLRPKTPRPVRPDVRCRVCDEEAPQIDGVCLRRICMKIAGVTL